MLDSALLVDDLMMKYLASYVPTDLLSKNKLVSTNQ